MIGIILLVLRLLMAISLYLFLGWVVLSLWQNLKFQKEIITSQQIPEIGLRVKYQDDFQVHRYSKPAVTIGRGLDCECILTSEKVSEHHARVFFSQNQWWIEDLNSTNGSFLNQERLSEPTVVINGDQLRCGDVEIVILVENGLNPPLGVE